MALTIGQTILGPRGAYKITELLKAPSLFKGQVLPGSSITLHNVVIKACSTEAEKTALTREFHLFKHRSIATSPYFRACHDFIGWEVNETPGSVEQPCDAAKSLILEWMESDLRSIPYQSLRARPQAIKSISRAILSALQLLQEEFQAIHTDINPNNVFLTNLDGETLTAKIGDLGNVVQEGYNKYRAQSLATRAPEVWLGLGCWHSSDVWSVGVTLVHSLLPATIFGARGKMVEGLTEAWCIAKIARLVGPIPAEAAKAEYQEEFFVSEEFAFNTFHHPDTGLETAYINVGSVREELMKAPGPELPSELIDFIDMLLTIDHTKRPSAKEALQHPFLQNN